MRTVCLCICLFFVSCATQSSLPVLHTVAGDESAAQICPRAFVGGDWQFVHSITFTTAGGHGSTLVGVTVLQAGTLHTVLMGVEGFVLFEAEQQYNEKLFVKKAMPPFDKSGFAEGLMADVQTLFFEPSFDSRLLAENKDGELVCRYRDKNDLLTDVVTAERGWNRITRYDAGEKAEQTIVVRQYRDVAGDSVPQRIHLTSTGTAGYTLQLELLSADKL